MGSECLPAMFWYSVSLMCIDCVYGGGLTWPWKPLSFAMSTFCCRQLCNQAMEFRASARRNVGPTNLLRVAKATDLLLGAHMMLIGAASAQAFLLEGAVVPDQLWASVFIMYEITTKLGASHLVCKNPLAIENATAYFQNLARLPAEVADSAEVPAGAARGGRA